MSRRGRMRCRRRLRRLRGARLGGRSTTAVPRIVPSGIRLRIRCRTRVRSLLRWRLLAAGRDPVIVR